jgi:hypothetical protein
MSDEYIYIPFPKALYQEILLSFGPSVDPVQFVTQEVNRSLEQRKRAALSVSRPKVRHRPLLEDLNDLLQGHQWGPVFLLNGTRLRLPWRGLRYHARVRGTEVHAAGTVFSSVRDWMMYVSGERDWDEWAHVQIKRPRDDDFRSAVEIRDEDTKRSAR